MYTLLPIPAIESLHVDNVRKAIARETLLYNLDPSTGIKIAVSVVLPIGTLLSMGTEQHHTFIKDLLERKVRI